MFDFFEDFNKHKDNILEILISYYGEEYRDLITKRFNLIVFDFSSSPIDEFNYILEHKDKFSRDVFLSIDENYDKYQELSEELEKQYMKQFSKLLLDEKQLNSLSPENRFVFISLFSDENFNESLIDILTTEMVDMVNNPLTPEIIKDKILKVQMKFFELLDALGIENPDQFLGIVADVIVAEREKYKIDYEFELVKQYMHPNFNINNEFYQRFGVNLSDNDLRSCFFFDGPFMAPMHNYLIDEIDFIPKIIKMPVIYHMNLGFYNCDVSLMHEIIHAIENNEKNYSIGIHLYKEDIDHKKKLSNRIANEVRTQMLAMKIVEELHQKGIFILDSPSNYFNYGSSAYEKLIPFVQHFFLEFENFINECAINGDLDKLYSGFGNTWNDFSVLLDESFNDYLMYQKFVNDNMDLNIKFDNYDYLFDEMRNCYYQRYGNKGITKKKNYN